MGRLRWTAAIVTGAVLAWGALAACGSERPAPAITNRDPDAAGPLGDGDGGPTFDARPPIDGTVQCPDVPYGLQIESDAARSECVCRHRNSDGIIASIPCTFGVCVGSANAGWFCNATHELFYVPGVGVGTCDAAAVPADALPCDPGF